MATGTGNLPYSMSPVSPFDVITSQAENEKIANIESLADGTGIGDKAVTLPKINGGTTAGVLTTNASGVVSAVPARVSYSTSEQDTGMKWIDGKTIYQKTVDVGNLPNATTKSVAHGITGLGRVVRVEGYSSDTSGDRRPIPYHNSGATNNTALGVNATDISLTSNGDRSGYSGYVTIWYTKA